MQKPVIPAGERLKFMAKESRTIGLRLVQVRGFSNLTQEGFAKENGISLSSLINYELEHIAPQFSFLVRLCEKYNLDANWLLLGDDIPAEKGSPTEIPITLLKKFLAEYQSQHRRPKKST